MKCTSSKITLMSNQNGIMEYCMYFGISNRIKANTRLYFYKYEFLNVVEIEFMKGDIHIYYYDHTPIICLDRLRDNIQFYKGYFESAGLEGKRFLFDVELRMPISYEDFDITECPNLVTGNHIFILDKGTGYITEKKSVVLYIPTSVNSQCVDNSILAMMNSLINVSKPLSNVNIDSCVILSVVSGLLSGIGITGIKNELQEVDLQSKFYNTVIKDVIINSANVDTRAKGLKTDKFKEMLSNRNLDLDFENFQEGKILLSRIVSMGLDKFSRIVDNGEKPIEVDLDLDTNIKRMFIKGGVAFINPKNGVGNLDEYIELLSSDKIVFLMN